MTHAGLSEIAASRAALPLKVEIAGRGRAGRGTIGKLIVLPQL